MPENYGEVIDYLYGAPERARREERRYEDQQRAIQLWKSRWNELTPAQRDMWRAVCRAYKTKLWRPEAHDNTQYEGWVTRADIAQQLSKLRLFPYHINNLAELAKHRWLRMERRARWLDRWDGVRQANGYEYVYEPSADALAALEAAKKPAPAPIYNESLPSERPVIRRNKSLLDRVKDAVLDALPI